MKRNGTDTGLQVAWNRATYLQGWTFSLPAQPWAFAPAYAPGLFLS